MQEFGSAWIPCVRACGSFDGDTPGYGILWAFHLSKSVNTLHKKRGEKVENNSYLLETLKEFGNISGGNAAASLALLMDTQVYLSVSKVDKMTQLDLKTNDLRVEEHMISILSVSYTHLDVYKRQGNSSTLYAGHCFTWYRTYVTSIHAICK